MKREYTNIIRFLMDELVPPIIRDSYWFMYPFFYFAYGTRKNLRRKMQFKSLAYSMNSEEYKAFCIENLVPFKRETNLCESNIKMILGSIRHDFGNVLDVGCGNGYLLNRVAEINPNLELFGLDIMQDPNLKNVTFTKGDISKVSFADNHFDTVICTHTLEHIIDVQKAFDELIRITKRKLIIVVPCQRYFYYSVDGHMQFFNKEAELLRYLPFKKFTLKKLHMDWVYIGEK